MDPSRLTQKSQEALQEAQTKAIRYRHTEADGEHLLLALLEQPDGLVPRLLAAAGADPERLHADVEADLERRPRVSGPGASPGPPNAANVQLIYIKSVGRQRILVAPVRGGTRTRMPEDPKCAARGVYQFHHAHTVATDFVTRTRTATRARATRARTPHRRSTRAGGSPGTRSAAGTLRARAALRLSRK